MTTLTRMKLEATTASEMERPIRYCRWENLAQKKCPFCFSWVEKNGEGVRCTDKTCNFKKETDEILEGISARFDRFASHLDSKDRGHIRSTLRELKIHL